MLEGVGNGGTGCLGSILLGTRLRGEAVGRRGPADVLSVDHERMVRTRRRKEVKG